MSRIRKYFALTPVERALVRRSLVLLPVVTLLLRACGMERTCMWLRRLAPPAAGVPLSPDKTAFLVGAAASNLRTRCLPRSLVLLHFLRAHGSRAEVRLGVAKLADGSLSAHAWVELDGVPLNDGPDVAERYAALPSHEGRFPGSDTKTLSL